MPCILLASQSRARRRILDQAGIHYKVCSPSFDEEAAKIDLVTSQASLIKSASTLALGKAKRGSLDFPNGICVGSDQLCSLEGKWLNKPKDGGEVSSQLDDVSGKTVTYTTAISLCENGQEVWQHVEEIRVQYRNLSFAQKEWYIKQRSEESFQKEGLLLIEGVGIQLIESIEGSNSGLLGLPVIPLIGELQRRGLLEV